MSAPFRNAVEVGEQIVLNPLALLFLLLLLQQIVNENLGVDFFLDVERRRVDHEVAPVLLILAAPDELRVEIAVAALVGNTDRVLLLLVHDGLKLRRGNVLPLVGVVHEGFDGLRGGLLRGFLRRHVAALCLFLKLRFLNLAPKGQRHASPGHRPGNWIGC